MNYGFQNENGLQKLLTIIRILRSPDGCPWDRQQKKEDIGKYLLEEAYETVEALGQGSPEDQKEELGDLLFQILFLAQLAEEAGEFNVSDVMENISEKMIRRHTHVFSAIKVKNIEEIKTNWEDIKKNVEKKDITLPGLLGKLPRSLPALLKAQQITENVSKIGFDWENIESVFAKVEEELSKLKSVLKSNNKKNIEEEIGDVLFSLVNLCRFARVNAEIALNSSVKKFINRFSHMENMLARQNKSIAEVSLEEMDLLWNEAKIIEKERP